MFFTSRTSHVLCSLWSNIKNAEMFAVAEVWVSNRREDPLCNLSRKLSEYRNPVEEELARSSAHVALAGGRSD